MQHFSAVLYGVAVLALLVCGLGSNACLRDSTPVEAQVVIGMPDFDSQPPNSFASRVLPLPTSLAVSPATGKLLVASDHHNYARYLSSALFVSGLAPEHRFNKSNCRVKYSRRGLAIDGSDSLWSSDEYSHQVFKIENASSLVTSFPSSAIVIGQPMRNCLPSSAPDGLNMPFGIWFDQNRDALWVADAQNDRVLMYGNTSSLAPSGANASLILGRTRARDEPYCSQDSFLRPAAVAIDPQGNLWVADTSCHRVLKFNNPYSLSHGAPADLVIGQTVFTSRLPGSSAAKLSGPTGLTFDDSGALYVSENGNQRINVYLDALNQTQDGASADFQIGQAGFDLSTTSPPSQTSLFCPLGIFYDSIVSHSLLVTSAFESRVLRYCSDSSPPPLPFQSITPTPSYVHSARPTDGSSQSYDSSSFATRSVDPSESARISDALSSTRSISKTTSRSTSKSSSKSSSKSISKSLTRSTSRPLSLSPTRSTSKSRSISLTRTRTRSVSKLSRSISGSKSRSISKTRSVSISISVSKTITRSNSKVTKSPSRSVSKPRTRTRSRSISRSTSSKSF
eukprot:TRINITY_DN5465_c0_g1_i1.p1 TRINITY_DN5465_c0_g1~~TRINITY_DN5465_c0_g1_i1.p1  ORF type:complete len:581 (+),score=96.29 TRINITY_DN5465_c0_g1_i1:46-1743(+)